MRATAISRGAATIINAIAAGRGAGFGIDLYTTAAVSLRDDGKINSKITGHDDESTLLIEMCIREVFDYFNANKEMGADVVTESNIPVARGLKSSSTAANAIVLAAASALEKEGIADLSGVADETLIKLGVKAAIRAKVTITGAYDDASASFFGGFVVTDNKKMEIIKRGTFEDMQVMIFAPAKKTYTQSVNVKRMKLLARQVDIAWNQALSGNLYDAITLNGIIYCASTGNNPDIAIEALGAGAVAAGLSGTGPAVVSLVPDSDVADLVEDVWQQFDGDIIKARVNNEKAKIIE